MKNKNFPFVGFVLLLIFCGNVQSASAGKFEEANQAYRDGKFDKAKALYEELAKNNSGQPVFQYNLGNANFRLQDVGRAILAYERALRLDPRNSDIRKNLQYVREGLPYRLEDRRNWYLKAADSILKYATANETLLATLLIFFLFALNWWIASFVLQKYQWGYGRKLTLVLLLLSSMIYAGKIIQVHVIREAIILEKEAKVRYGPSLNDQIAFRMGEGLKAYVLDRREHWLRILLTNGETGWIQESSLELV